MAWPDGVPSRTACFILRSVWLITRHSIRVASAGTYWGLDIGELLQDVRGQDWPDHVEDLVDGQLGGDGVHWCSSLVGGFGGVGGAGE